MSRPFNVGLLVVWLASSLVVVWSIGNPNLDFTVRIAASIALLTGAVLYAAGAEKRRRSEWAAATRSKNQIIRLSALERLLTEQGAQRHQSTERQHIDSTTRPGNWPV